MLETRRLTKVFESSCAITYGMLNSRRFGLDISTYLDIYRRESLLHCVVLKRNVAGGVM